MYYTRSHTVQTFHIRAFLFILTYEYKDLMMGVPQQHGYGQGLKIEDIINVVLQSIDCQHVKRTYEKNHNESSRNVGGLCGMNTNELKMFVGFHVPKVT